MLPDLICPACGTWNAQAAPGLRVNCRKCNRNLQPGLVAPAEHQFPEVLPAAEVLEVLPHVDLDTAYRMGAKLLAAGTAAPWISRQLIGRGLDPTTAAWIEYELLAEAFKKRQRTGFVHLAIGGLLGVSGLAATAVSLATAAGSGGKLIAFTGAIAGGLVEVIRGVILLCSSDSVPPQPRTGAPAGRPSSAEQLVRNVHHAVAGDVLPSGTAVPSLSPATMVQATPAIPTAAASSRRVWPLLAGGVGVLFGLPLALAALGLLIRSWSGSSLPQVSPTAVRASGDWLVLFASDDPRIWNRDVDEGPNRFARSLFGVPNAVHYLRLRRGDDYVIIAMDKARLTQTSDDGHYGWEGTNHTDSGAHHLGIYSRVLPATGQGDISVRILPWCRGWGFGHRAFVNNGQGYCWDGKPIPPTVFEIAVKPGRLTAEESKRLLSR